ncbi:MAG: hypothetical protein MZU84_04125 [Sphingobacterium sp.]|nr:hypothetical protein [Sphingobacterium sp.]
MADRRAPHRRAGVSAGPAAVPLGAAPPRAVPELRPLLVRVQGRAAAARGRAVLPVRAGARAPARPPRRTWPSRAFVAVGGQGYGRVDIRLEERTDELFVLEVNANCGISGDKETSVGEILLQSEIPATSLVSEILRDAYDRHARQRAPAAGLIHADLRAPAVVRGVVVRLPALRPAPRPLAPAARTRVPPRVPG